MDACSLCRSPIARDYYRVGTAMACPDCAEKVRRVEVEQRGLHFRQGVLAAVIVAFLGVFAKWGANEFASLGGASSVFGVGAWVRGGSTLLLGAFVGVAAKAGAKGRGSRPLAACAVVLTYFAYALAFAPQIWLGLPTERHSFLTFIAVILASLMLPFSAVLVNIIAISGLVVLTMACFSAASVAGPTELLSGPFDNTVRMPEKPMFKGLGS